MGPADGLPTAANGLDCLGFLDGCDSGMVGALMRPRKAYSAYSGTNSDGIVDLRANERPPWLVSLDRCAAKRVIRM